jgi:hypothetical protein
MIEYFRPVLDINHQYSSLTPNGFGLTPSICRPTREQNAEKRTTAESGYYRTLYSS